MVVNVTSYLGLGLMAARTSILKLGEAVKDGMGYLFIICIQVTVHRIVINELNSKHNTVNYLFCR